MNLAQRVFSYEDQYRFAESSGDCNPMHMDPLQARRTQAGAPVVHGIHLLLWALDALASAHPQLPPLRALRSQFKSFVFLEEVVEIDLAQMSPAAARLTVAVKGSPRSIVKVEFGSPDKSLPHWEAQPLEPGANLSMPLNLSLDEIPHRAGRFPSRMTTEQASTMFPAAVHWLGSRPLTALAATTQLVGMVCPGLHSIYSELSVSMSNDPAATNSLAFRVTEVDQRFRSVEQEIVSGPFWGVVKCFLRHLPAQQATMRVLAQVLAPAEFTGSTALIVGGSRGLGELTAKIIASGGGRVVITWQSGKDDAERVAEEIRAAGGSCGILSYDARKPVPPQLAALPAEPTHAYYFPTPAIFRPQSAIFSSDRFNEFLSIYVDGFWNLAWSLLSRQPHLSLYYPSSVAVTDRPKGMTEYAMAKTAGEALCADMNIWLAPAHVTVSRLPRLPTDQTASVTPVDAADPVETMLPIIREVQSWPR